MATHHILISGKVQGVFYRMAAKKKATELGVTGWVTNKDNGDVEIVASGDVHSLAEIAAWCRLGPANAEVTNVVITNETATVFVSFTIK